MSDSIGLGELAAAHFEPLVGETFAVRLSDRIEQIVLTTVEIHQSQAGEGARARVPFTLTFTGTTPDLLLHQGIHAIGHLKIGRHELFLVPSARNPDGTHQYEVAFA